ncbi:MAG: ABC transporter ATP-binding protein [Jatrophihabitans sp.]
MARPILEVEDLVKHFGGAGRFGRRAGGAVRAVDGVSLQVGEGETVGIVGESGCGKSTLSRLIVRLLEPTSGKIVFADHDVSHLHRGELRTARRGMQMVFQDPFASLNRRMTVRQIIRESIRVHGGQNRAEVEVQTKELLSLVGLSRQHLDRFPHEFSGGQRQRISIARALALDPRLLVLDEPVSALDVSVQAQILNLVKDLQTQFGMSYIFISHDLSVVSHVADRVLVMYAGLIVESGTRAQVFQQTSHPYTHALLSAVPTHDDAKHERIVLHGEVPNPVSPPSGCRFRTRCWKATQRCADEVPLLIDRGVGHDVACHYPSTDSNAPADPEPLPATSE